MAQSHSLGVSLTLVILGRDLDLVSPQQVRVEMTLLGPLHVGTPETVVGGRVVEPAHLFSDLQSFMSVSHASDNCPEGQRFLKLSVNAV